MESFLLYIGKAALAAGAFYLLYLALFQRQKHFLFNRIYLPVSLALSFLIPLITFTSIRYIETTPVSYNGFAYLGETTQQVIEPAIQFQWFHYAIGIYLLGIFGFLSYLVLGHAKAIAIVRKSRLQKLFNEKVNVTFRDVHPFSFFNKIVLSEKTLDNPNLPMIVQHEAIHVRGKHTLDILFSEILFLFQWFNPFVWLLKDAIKNNLEFLTDDELTRTNDAQQYQLAMVGLAHKQGVAPFLTAMNGSQLKNRIIMMKKKTENKYALLKQLVALPLLAILVMGLSNREVKTEIVPAEKQFSIVVDGKKIPLNDPAFQNLDFSQKIDGYEIMLALGIEDKVLSNGMNIGDKESEIAYYIHTSDYVSGSNPEFDKLISQSAELNKEDAPKKTFHAVDGKILSEEEAKELDGKQFESAVILLGDDAVEKYGEEARKASALDLKTGEPKVKVSASEAVKEFSVKGKITDLNGDPISGAAVLINGTTVGTITDTNGDYLIKLDNKNETLVFVMSGFEKQEISVQGKNVINVQLNTVDQPKEGSIQIRPSDVPEGPYADKSGHGVAIRLNSPSQNEPLYIVDGIPVQDIKAIDPDNIEKINVLKGVQAAAIYGTRGEANGVIEIATKKKSTEVKEQPLYVLDGKVVQNVDYLNPDGIESIDVLKVESATAVYGEKGKNGVVVITTKAMAELNKAEPLIILDGEKTKIDISSINPEEIASISVFKDAEAIKKYGEDGKNGVILIRTKDYKITSETELRKFIAQQIVYPEEARIKGEEGIVQGFMKFGKENKAVAINSFTKKENKMVSIHNYAQKDIINLDDVVVVGHTENDAQFSSKNEVEMPDLTLELKRVLEMLPPVEIPEFKGKAVGVSVKFVLQ